MLVLRRKDQQSILIGDNIKVTLVKGENGEAWIGIEAPKDVMVLRTELLRRNESGPNRAA